MKDLENSIENVDFRSQKFFSRETFPEVNIILKETPCTITGNKCPIMKKQTKTNWHFDPPFQYTLIFNHWIIQTKKLIYLKKAKSRNFGQF